MIFKKAIPLAIVLWFVGFLAGILFILLIQPYDLREDLMMRGLLFSIMVVGSLLMTGIYFRQSRSKPCGIEGLKLGLLFVGIGALLDFILLFLYSLMAGNFDKIVTYYSSLNFMYTVGLLLTMPSLAGFVFARRAGA